MLKVRGSDFMILGLNDFIGEIFVLIILNTLKWGHGPIYRTVFWGLTAGRRYFKRYAT